MNTAHVLPITASCAAELPDKAGGDFMYGNSPAEIGADNFRRATFAAVAVKAYAKTTGVANGEAVGLAIADLLSDLRHLVDCLRAGTSDGDGSLYPLDFAALNGRGLDHYEAETRGEA